MSRVILTVRRSDDGQERDLEVPVDVEVGLLVELIGQALDWQTKGSGGTGYRLEALPLGRELGPRETLAEAGVWDGSWLVFHPEGQEAGRTTAPQGPAIRWRPLDVQVPGTNTESQPGESDSSGRFRWKRLDED